MKEIVWIDVRDALALHDRLLALDGGAPGLRDAGLLNSALARPQHLRAYGRKPDLAQLATAYAAGIIRNHPFVDGNKRTGFVVSVLFVEMNGAHFIANEEDATQAVMGLAAGTLDERAFATWLRANLKR